MSCLLRADNALFTCRYEVAEYRQNVDPAWERVDIRAEEEHIVRMANNYELYNDRMRNFFRNVRGGVWIEVCKVVAISFADISHLRNQQETDVPITPANNSQPDLSVASSTSVGMTSVVYKKNCFVECNAVYSAFENRIGAISGFKTRFH